MFKLYFSWKEYTETYKENISKGNKLYSAEVWEMKLKNKKTFLTTKKDLRRRCCSKTGLDRYQMKNKRNYEI